MLHAQNNDVGERGDEGGHGGDARVASESACFNEARTSDGDDEGRCEEDVDRGVDYQHRGRGVDP